MFELLLFKEQEKHLSLVSITYHITYGAYDSVYVNTQNWNRRCLVVVMGLF